MRFRRWDESRTWARLWREITRRELVAIASLFQPSQALRSVGTAIEDSTVEAQLLEAMTRVVI